MSDQLTGPEKNVTTGYMAQSELTVRTSSPEHKMLFLIALSRKWLQNNLASGRGWGEGIWLHYLDNQGK